MKKLSYRFVLLPALPLLMALAARAQTPSISALFPAGAKAGESVEVSVRGGNLAGAKRIVVAGAEGVTAELAASDTKVDASAKPLFEQKCKLCHEVRSPANRSMTPEQWAQVVDRMINDRSAPIAKDERDKIVTYLQATARAGQVIAKFKVAPNAAPGIREVRLLTDSGASTAYSFEVGTLAEVTATNGTSLQQPQKVTLPVVVNGAIARSTDRNVFGFEAKKGQRYTFNLKSFRLNQKSQDFFHPALYLRDARGVTVAKNFGYFGMDPLIDWTATDDGAYTVEVRDLMWSGSPSAVYRLAMGPITYDATVSPAIARPGATLAVRATGTWGPAQDATIRVPMEANGLTMVPTPAGEAPVLVRDYPEVGPNGRTGTPIKLPALLRGTILKHDQADAFLVDVPRGSAGLEVYTRRIGSPLRAQVRVLDAAGKELRSVTAEANADLTLQNVFPKPGQYVIEVTDADANSGAPFTYVVESPDAAPDFTLQVTPDNISIGPGGTAALVVKATRRQGIKGAIPLALKNLPPGITATTAVIPPDDDEAVIVLTAAAGAASDLRVVSLEGQVSENGVNVVRLARPMEVYQVNNQTRTYARTSLVVAVAAAAPDFTLVPSVDTLRLKPGEEAKVTVKVVRRDGFKGSVILSSPIGLPGVQGPRDINIPPGQQEAVLTYRAGGDARFLRERPVPDLPPMQVVITGTAGETVLSSAPIKIVGAAEEKKAASSN